MVHRLGLLVLMACLSAAGPLPEGPGFAGRVLDTDGKPVAGAWVEVRHADQGALAAADFEGAPSKSMRSDADGRWAFAELGEGIWIVTAVASTEPRADEELQRWARPGHDGETPAGVSIARVIRHIGAHPRVTREQLDIGLSLGSATARPLRGRLTSAFHPERFAYEVHFRRVSMVRVPDGQSVSTSFSSDDTTATYSTVPDLQGRFDFGAFDFTEHDMLDVETFALSEADTGVAGTPFSGVMKVLASSTDGVQIPLPDRRVVVLKTVTAEGRAVTPAPGDEGEYTVWDEHGTEKSWSPAEAVFSEPFPDGTYLARVTLASYASALTPFTVGGAGEGPEVALVLQPCTAFEVKLVDQNGAPLPRCFLKLGTEASAAFPAPQRVTAFCTHSTIALEGLLPGTYDVQFNAGKAPPFVRRLELKPDSGPVVVMIP